MIQEAIAKLLSRQHLTADEAETAMHEIMGGSATQSQIGAYLAGLRVNGETESEISGSARAMRERALRVNHSQSRIVDIVGTGGDQSGTFNISTTAAFVVAGAGVSVAKHGGRAASSQTGSGDVLSALGLNMTLTPEQVGVCIDEVGVVEVMRWNKRTVDNEPGTHRAKTQPLHVHVQNLRFGCV